MKTTILAYVIALGGVAMIAFGLWGLYILIRERIARRLSDYVPTIQTVAVGFGLIGVAQALRLLLVIFHWENSMFPNLEDFILGQQTSELYVLENFCCYYNARNCCCGTRIRNIKDHQCARTFDSGAIKRGQFTPGIFNYFSGCFLPIGCRVVQNMAESL